MLTDEDIIKAYDLADSRNPKNVNHQVTMEEMFKELKVKFPLKIVDFKEEMIAFYQRHHLVDFRFSVGGILRPAVKKYHFEANGKIIFWMRRFDWKEAIEGKK